MTRALVTGGRGFIGRHLIQNLRARGFAVTSLVRHSANEVQEFELPVDLSNEAAVARVLSELAPKHVFHLAGTTTPGRRLDRFPGLSASEVFPTVNLALALGPSVEMYYAFGSCEEYGSQEGPFREDQRLDAVSDYGWAKISNYYATNLICRQRGVPFCYLRPFLTYGPGQSSHLLVPHLIRACLEGRHVGLTSGLQKRDFLYVHDLIGMIGRIIDNPAPARGQTFNLCTGEPIAVREIGELIRELCGGGSLGWGEHPNRPNESKSFFGDLAKYSSLYGTYPRTDRREALAATVSAARAEPHP